MIIRYKDNKGTNLTINGRSTIFSSTDEYGLLLGETFEKMSPKLPLYNHKWMSFAFTTASNGYDKITPPPEEDVDFEEESETKVMSQDEFQDLIETYEEDITILVEYIYEWITMWEYNWKIIEKMKKAGEDEELVSLEEKDRKIKTKLQSLKLELGNKRLEKAQKLLVLATDNKDTKLIARYEKVIEGTKAQIQDAQNGVNLTVADKKSL